MNIFKNKDKIHIALVIKLKFILKYLLEWKKLKFYSSLIIYLRKVKTHEYIKVKTKV